MENRCRKYTVNFILLVVALQILNMSASGRIADDSVCTQIDDSVNIADHAVEFIVEDILGYTNAFPEVQEIKHKTPVSCCQKMQAFTLISLNHDNKIPYGSLLLRANYFLLQVKICCQYTGKINTPPPEIA